MIAVGQVWKRHWSAEFLSSMPLPKYVRIQIVNQSGIDGRIISASCVDADGVDGRAFEIEADRRGGLIRYRFDRSAA